MTFDPNLFKAQAPRDHDAPTDSELAPFKSTKIDIWKRKALPFLLIVGLAVVALFNLDITHTSDTMPFIYTIGCMGVLLIFLGIYYYSGIKKQWWWYFAPGIASWIILEYFFILYAIFFRQILPGNMKAVEHNPNFIPNFVASFFGAGLCEEWVKATPILIALVLTLREPALILSPTPDLKTTLSGKASWRQIKSGLALRGPLDGLLMGLAAGAAFILSETLFEYVPKYSKAMEVATKSDALGALFGLQLAIPRILQGVSGHMAWAGIFGYFIGLTARYPKRWQTILPTGYLMAAVLHGLWDSVGRLPASQLWFGAVTVVTILLLVSCLLKARQIEQKKNVDYFAGGSILAGSILPGRLQEPPIQPTPPAATPAPAVAPMPAPAALQRFSIGAGAKRFAMEADRAIDFTALFAAEGAPQGASAEISRRPAMPEVLGLKNTGTVAWMATTPDGATASVTPGKHIRIAAGTRLTIGPLAVVIEAY